eukprot:m51a1_g12029 putative complement factor h (283) ;mRNA; r:2516-3413
MMNQLSGPIPAELGNLTNLLTLQLDANRLGGTVPPSVSARTGSICRGNPDLCVERANKGQCELPVLGGFTAVPGTCSGSWEPQPTCVASPCPLPPPRGASGWGTCSSSVPSGTACTLDCSAGFAPVTGSCESGTWHSQPGCAALPCRVSPPITAEGMGSCANSSVATGTTCELQCRAGTLSVPGTCGVGGWATEPTCAPAPCGLFPSAGASGWGTCSSSVPSGANCTLECSQGFTSVRGTCASGRWSAAPTCLAIAANSAGLLGGARWLAVAVLAIHWNRVL